MVQIFTFNGVVGTLLTESDLSTMVELREIHGKKKYFIPSKKSKRPAFSREELVELINSGKSFSEIANYYEKSISWLNAKLLNIFGTSSHKIIMTKIGETQIQAK